MPAVADLEKKHIYVLDSLDQDNTVREEEISRHIECFKYYLRGAGFGDFE